MPSGAGDQFKFPEPQPLTHSIVPVLLRITREWIFCHIPDPSSPSSSAGCHILLCWSHGREPCRGTHLSSSHPLHQHWEGSPGCWCFHAAPSGGEQGLQGPSCSSLLLSGAQTLQEKLPWKWQLQQGAGSRTRPERWGQQSHCLEQDMARVTQPARQGREANWVNEGANPDRCSCRALSDSQHSQTGTSPPSPTSEGSSWRTRPLEGKLAAAQTY